MGRYIKGNVDENLALGTLATDTGITTPFDESATERMLCSSIEAAYSIQGVTATDNAGPIMVGIAHEDYTLAEIEEFIESTGSWNEGDLISQEIAKRKIRKIGIFAQEGPDLSWQALNEGKPIKTKLNWILTTGKGLQLWAYNLGSASLATTNPNVHCTGHVNLWPQ